MADETIQQPPVTPKYKLWQSLNSASYYTKPYADFDKQFSTPEQINKLHSALSSSEYYTKSSGEFTQQFFTPEKKNPIGNDGQNIAGLSQPGSNLIPNSQQSDLSPILPENRDAIRQQQQAQVQSEIQSKADQVKQTRQLLGDKDYMANVLNNMATSRQDKINQANDPNSDYYKNLKAQEALDEKNAYHGSISLSDRVASASNSVYRGLGNYGKGLVRAGGELAKLITPNSMGYGDRYDADVQKVNDAIDKGVQWAKDYHGLDNKKEAAINKGAINGMINGLAEYAPAIGDAERTGGVSFFINDYEHGYENIDKADKENGLNLSDGQKQAYATVNGTVSALLMTHNLHSLLGNASEKATQSIIQSVSHDVIGDLAKSGEDLTADNLKKTTNVALTKVEDKVKNFGVKAIKSTATSTGDLAALEALKIHTDKLTNTLTGKRVFDTSNEAERMHSAMISGFGLGAAGSILRAPMLLSKGGEERNSVIESLYKNPSDENATTIKNALSQHLGDKGFTPEDIAHTHGIVDQIHQIAKSLPEGLDSDKQVKVADLIMQRKDLEKTLADTNEKNKKLDPVFTQGGGNEDVITQNRIDGINDKIKSIATDMPIKYFKQDGEFYKQFGDQEPEKINENRYLAEKPSRTIAPNEQTVYTNNSPLNNNENESSNQEGSQKETGTESEEGQKEVPVPAQEEVVKSGTDKTVPETIDAKNVSSIKNAKIDEDRQKRGLSPLMSETAKDFPKVWDEAMQKLEDNTDASKDLVKELAENPRSTTDVENALLAHRLVEVKNKYDKLTEQIVKAQDAGEDTTDLNDKLDNVSDELHEIESVSKSTGRETARGLNSRKMMIKDDFSLAALETKKRVATGRKLTTEEREGIRKIHADYEEKSKAYEQKIADLEQRNRDLIERDALQRLKAEAKKEGRAKTRSQRDATKSKLIDDIRTKLKESRIKSQQLKSDIPFRQQFADLIKISPELAKLAKLYIDEGVDKLDDLVDKLHDELKDAYDGLSKRAVRDALSGYGKESEPVTKGDLQVKLEELRKQAKLQSKLEDLEAKEYKSPERKKQQVSEEIAGLKKQIRDLEQPDISLKALKTRTSNQIKEYERRLKERDFSTAPPRIPIMLDPEAITARANLDRVRDDFNAELEKDRLANRGKFEKGFDTFLKYRRAELLLNLSGAAKVGMASAYRILGQPLHEIAGSGLRQIPGLKQIAEKAPREGAGFVSDVEWKALKSIWSSETLAEVKKKFQGKLDSLDTAFGDKKEHFDANRLLDLAGNIHSAEKAFAKQNEFRRSVLLRTKWATEHGVDIENPFVQLKIGVEALEDANRQIFMGSNLANDLYRELLGSAESKSKENKYGKLGKISAGALKVLLPIVRVPTNFLIEKAQYTPVLGATKAFYLMSKGLENLQPKEADYVMRVMKKQSLGVGLMMIGYFNPQAFGGFYVPGGKRKEGDLAANDIKLFGVNVPHFLTHTPLLTIMQLGATIRRAADGDNKNPVGNTSLAIGGDFAESTPFYETPKQAIKAMESAKNMQQFIGGFLRGLLIPNLVAQEAAREDKDSEGNPIKRNPQTIADGIKEGIPGLRKEVPVKLPHPGFDKISLGEKEFTLNNDQILEREKYYNQYLKSEYGTKLQDLIKNVKTEKQKKKFTTILHGNASKFSKVKILQKYRNEKTGGYSLMEN